ncbi:site-2 protease family protein [Demequina muriae]|uniref:Zinc metalloprotease n=1 Tax=Demequina muriae TaxID=3051664 RepID=A0ABT8GDI2_9MICO|nr:site-2 protease family protein [Demequina sp. EGI L300058]MDN4479346.1 site-2 protease family protein [Demequina sp. EGI L300058]
MTDVPRPTRGLSLGRAFGGRIVVQPSTLVMLAILAFVFATNGGGALDRRSFTVGLVLAVLLFASVLVHEIAHAAAARAFKRQVHEVVLTLWGGHTTFDARGMTPTVSGVTALAGPLANVALAGIGALALASGALDFTFVEMLEGDLTAAGIVRYLVYVNLVLAAFNALPGIPMDGGRVLEAIVWGVTGDRYRGVRVAAWAGRVIAVGVVLVALALPLTQGRVPGLFDVMWAVLVFVILWPAASSALRAAQALGRRQGVFAGTVMVPAIAVRFDATVEDARTQAHQAGAQEVVVISADGAPAGHFPVTLTDAVPPEQRGAASLQSVTMPLPRGAAVPADLTGEGLQVALREWWGRTDVWTVAEAGRIVGVVRLEDVMKALQ